MDATTIARVLRAKDAVVRSCYVNGSTHHPNLQGQVTIGFVIDRSGWVTVARDGGSDLPDLQTVFCIVLGLADSKFPNPRRMVIVDYSIQLSPLVGQDLAQAR